MYEPKPQPTMQLLFTFVSAMILYVSSTLVVLASGPASSTSPPPGVMEYFSSALALKVNKEASYFIVFVFIDDIIIINIDFFLCCRLHLHCLVKVGTRISAAGAKAALSLSSLVHVLVTSGNWWAIKK
jgi:hypothetical protein